MQVFIARSDAKIVVAVRRFDQHARTVPKGASSSGEGAGAIMSHEPSV